MSTGTVLALTFFETPPDFFEIGEGQGVGPDAWAAEGRGPQAGGSGPPRLQSGVAQRRRHRATAPPPGGAVHLLCFGPHFSRCGGAPCWPPFLSPTQWPMNPLKIREPSVSAEGSLAESGPVMRRACSGAVPYPLLVPSGTFGRNFRSLRSRPLRWPACPKRLGVPLVRGGLSSRPWGSQNPFPVYSPRCREKWAFLGTNRYTPTNGNRPGILSQSGYRMVGATGLEPVTSSVSRKRTFLPDPLLMGFSESLLFWFRPYSARKSTPHIIECIRCQVGVDLGRSDRCVAGDGLNRPQRHTGHHEP